MWSGAHFIEGRINHDNPSYAAAKEIAQSKISSGDEVVLSLHGARWVEAAPGISTPGRSVDTELEYKRRLVCEVCMPIYLMPVSYADVHHV